MPRNAIAAEAADFVLPPDKTAKELQEIARTPQIVRIEMESREEMAVNKPLP